MLSSAPDTARYPRSEVLGLVMAVGGGVDTDLEVIAGAVHGRVER